MTASAPPPPPMQPPPGGPAPKKDNTLLILLVIGAVLLGGCCFLGVLAAIAIPNIVKARQGANESAAIGALRTLTTAQALHREGDKDHNDILDYADGTDVLAREGLIDPMLGAGTRQGYRFRIEHADPLHWSATAEPLAPGQTGGRAFFVDESGVIRFRPAGTGTPGPGDTMLQ